MQPPIQAQPSGITQEQILEMFFKMFYELILMKITSLSIPEDVIELFYADVYNESLEFFQNTFFVHFAKQDLAGVIEIKKKIEKAYQGQLNMIKTMYLKPEVKPENLESEIVAPPQDIKDMKPVDNIVQFPKK